MKTDSKGEDDELALLCRSCGLCCDGSLFGRVGLAPREVDAARKHRLRVVPAGTSFEQPCSALTDGICAIYRERPEACRKFICHLYHRQKGQGVPLATSLAAVRRARELLALVQRTPAAEDAMVELMDRLERDFGRAASE